MEGGAVGPLSLSEPVLLRLLLVFLLAAPRKRPELYYLLVMRFVPIINTYNSNERSLDKQSFFLMLQTCLNMAMETFHTEKMVDGGM